MTAYAPPAMLNLVKTANMGVVTPTIAAIVTILLWVEVWVWVT